LKGDGTIKIRDKKILHSTLVTMIEPEQIGYRLNRKVEAKDLMKEINQIYNRMATLRSESDLV